VGLEWPVVPAAHAPGQARENPARRAQR